MIPIGEQIKCIEREISMRYKVYPRRVKEGRMHEDTMRREIATMEAVKQSLEQSRAQQELFKMEPQAKH